MSHPGWFIGIRKNDLLFHPHMMHETSDMQKAYIYVYMLYESVVGIFYFTAYEIIRTNKWVVFHPPVGYPAGTW